MPETAFDWNDLRHFLSVARSGSLSAATRGNGAATSPATIGRRIQALEAALGLVLFERLSSGYVLTPAGRDLMARAETAEAAMLALAHRGGDESATDNLQGSVRLATGETLASHLIAPHVARFHAAHPGLRLELVSGVRASSLTRREADLALRLIRPDQGDLVRRKVGVAGFGLYASRSHVDAHPAIRDDPWSADLIGWDATMGDIPLAVWLHDHARGRTVATATSGTVQWMLAQSGVGAALLPCLLADGDDRLIRLVGPADAISFDIWLAAPRDLSRTPRVRAALDFIADLCAREETSLSGQ